MSHIERVPLEIDFFEADRILTVGIPHFEQFEQLLRTLHSISKLINGERINVLVSDNHSTNYCLTRINQAARGIKNFEVYRHHSNLGPAENFKFILENSQTDYVWILGAGELVEKESLEVILPILKERHWIGGTISPKQNKRRAIRFVFRKSVHRSERLCCLPYRESISLNLFNRMDYLSQVEIRRSTGNLWPHIEWSLAVNSVFPNWSKNRFHIRTPLVEIDRSGDVWFRRDDSHMALLNQISLLQSVRKKSKSLLLQYFVLVLVELPRIFFGSLGNPKQSSQMIRDAYRIIHTEPLSGLMIQLLSLVERAFRSQ